MSSPGFPWKQSLRQRLSACSWFGNVSRNMGEEGKGVYSRGWPPLQVLNFTEPFWKSHKTHFRIIYLGTKREADYLLFPSLLGQKWSTALASLGCKIVRAKQVPKGIPCSGFQEAPGLKTKVQHYDPRGGLCHCTWVKAVHTCTELSPSTGWEDFTVTDRSCLSLWNISYTPGTILSTWH